MDARPPSWQVCAEARGFVIGLTDKMLADIEGQHEAALDLVWLSALRSRLGDVPGANVMEGELELFYAA